MPDPYHGKPGGLIYGKWRGFAAASLPSNATAEQRRAVRIAFYYGCMTSLAALYEEQDMPDADRLRRLDRLNLELLEFQMAVDSGAV